MKFARNNEWTTFESSSGYCGIAWTKNGFDRFILPSLHLNEVEEEMIFRDENRPRQVPPKNIAGYIERIKKHLAGSIDPLIDLPVDLEHSTAFCRSIYTALRKIGPGQTITYGTLATLIGKPGAARAVGRAMGANPLPLIIPCHRVLPSSGELGGFSGKGGTALKASLLKLEGANWKDKK